MAKAARTNKDWDWEHEWEEHWEDECSGEEGWENDAGYGYHDRSTVQQLWDEQAWIHGKQGLHVLDNISAQETAPPTDHLPSTNTHFLLFDVHSWTCLFVLALPKRRPLVMERERARKLTSSRRQPRVSDGVT